MHGMIFSELHHYVEHKQGQRTWDTLLEGADLKGRVYLASGEYPDAEGYGADISRFCHDRPER